MTDKEKIRDEIERRMNCYDKSGIDIEKYFAVEDEDLLEFIDSMQEKPVSEDLEEVAHQYYEPNDTFMDGFKKGANWQKEQMIKEAKDGVITFDYYGDDDKTYGCIAHDSFSLEELGLKDGDKVKLIIIKEGKQ